MTRYLTVKEVLRIHWRAMKTFGGSRGVRDLDLLESAIARPKVGFGEYEAYPDIVTKAAVLLYSLITYHPFMDGNKRTGLTATQIFLQRNGYKIDSSNEELIDFVVAIAKGKLTETEVVTWIAEHTKSI